MTPARLLQISRPGLWFPTLWLYFVPLGQIWPWAEWRFWLGLGFVTFPLNFITYGWNDRVDADTDALNPRKGSFLFGARPNAAERAALPGWIGAVAVASAGAFLLAAGPELLGVFALMLAFNWLYNDVSGGLRQRPPWELLAQAGYLLVVPLSVLLNDAQWPKPAVWGYLALFAVQSHLIGEVMDIEPDRKSGRRTTATLLGAKRTKLLIAGCVAVELTIVAGSLADVPLSLMLAAGLVWLVVDLLWLFRNDGYSLQQMRVAGVGSNVLALVSAVYVWISGCLLTP
jgi:4-hydroxybenzoate polyprenyltransferase